MKETYLSSGRNAGVFKSQLDIALENCDLPRFNALLSFGVIRDGELRREHIGQAVSLAFANASTEARYAGLFGLARGLCAVTDGPLCPEVGAFYQQLAKRNVAATFLPEDTDCLFSTGLGAVLLYAEEGSFVRAVCDVGNFDAGAVLAKILQTKDLGRLSGFAVAEDCCGDVHQYVATDRAFEFAQQVEDVMNRPSVQRAGVTAKTGQCHIPGIK